MRINNAQIEKEIIRCLTRRAVEASACPSEIARALLPRDNDGWRDLLPRIREVATSIARDGRVVVTRRARELPAEELGGGPIRLRRGRHFLAGKEK